MTRFGKIAILCCGALWAVFTVPQLRAQLRTVPQALLDSLSNPGTAAGAGAIHFDRTHIDAGTLSEDDSPKSFTFRWLNGGSTPLVITRVETTCGCLVPAYSKQPVHVGGQGTLSVTYHPKGHPGSFQRKIFVYTQLSAKKPTAILELRGRVTPSVRPTHDYPHVIGPLLLKQQTVHMSGQQMQVERIEYMNSGGKPLTITDDKRLTPPYIGFSSEPETIGPGKIGDLVISFDPAKAPAKIPGQILLFLRGVEVPPSQRAINVRIGETK